MSKQPDEWPLTRADPACRQGRVWRVAWARTGSGPSLQVTSSRRGRTAVLVLAGELDIATAPRLRTSVSDVLAADPPQVLVLDLSGLAFVDATGISVLVAAQRAVTSRGGSLCVRSPSRLVRRLIRLLDLEAVLPVEG